MDFSSRKIKREENILIRNNVIERSLVSSICDIMTVKTFNQRLSAIKYLRLCLICVRIFVITGIFDSFPKWEESTVSPRITFLGRSRLSCLLTFLSSWKIKHDDISIHFVSILIVDLRRRRVCLKFGLCKL